LTDFTNFHFRAIRSNTPKLGAFWATKSIMQQDPAHWLAFAGRSSPDLPSTWIVDRSFDPQHAALLVVHFDRILLDPVFNPGAFHPVFKIGADFSVEPTTDAALQESQNISAAAVLDGMFYQLTPHADLTGFCHHLR